MVEALQDVFERARGDLHVRHRVLQIDERRLAELAVAHHGAEESLAPLDGLEDDAERRGHLDDVRHDVAALAEHGLVVDRVDGRDQAPRRQRCRVGRAGGQLDVAVAQQAERADGGDAVVVDARCGLAEHVDQHLDVARRRVGREAHLGDGADGNAGQAHRCAHLQAVGAREVHLVLDLALPELLLAAERHDGRDQDGERHEDEESDAGRLAARSRHAHRARVLMQRSGTRGAADPLRPAPPPACP